MASLTEIAISTRKTIRYGIYGVIFLIIARFLFLGGRGLYNRLFPEPPPPPTVAFGKLPTLPFPEAESKNFSYTLETPTGTLPTLPDQMKVYFMPRLSARLLSLDVAKDRAESLGFLPEPVEISPTVYQFPHERAPATLEINISTGAFSIGFDLNAAPEAINKIPPAPEIAASKVKGYLSSANLLAPDVKEGPVVHEFLQVSEGKVVGALSLSESNMIKINLFRESYDEYPSLTKSPTEGNIFMYVTGATRREHQIVAGQFRYFPVDRDKSATYPIKTASAAWEELAAGHAFFARVPQGEAANVTVRRIYLGYFDPGVQTDFYQPVFVFEGDDGFVAYLPAVTDEFYGE